MAGDPVVRKIAPTPGETGQCSLYHPLFVDLNCLFQANSPGGYVGEAAILRDRRGGPWYPPPACKGGATVPTICVNGLYQNGTHWVYHGYWTGQGGLLQPKLLAGVWSSEAAYIASPAGPDKWPGGWPHPIFMPLNADGTWTLDLLPVDYTYASTDYIVVRLLAPDAPSADAAYRIALPAAAVAGDLYPYSGMRLALEAADFQRIRDLALTDPEWGVSATPPLPAEYAAMNRCMMRAVRQQVLDTRGIDLTEFQVSYLTNPLRPERIPDPVRAPVGDFREAIVLQRVKQHCDGECYGVGEYDPAFDYRYWLVDQTIAAYLAGVSENYTGLTPWGRTFEWRGHLSYDLKRYSSARVLAQGYDSQHNLMDGWLLRLGPVAFANFFFNYGGMVVPNTRASYAIGDEATYNNDWSTFLQPPPATIQGWVDSWLRAYVGLYEGVLVNCTPWPTPQFWALQAFYVVDGNASPPSNMNQRRELSLGLPPGGADLMAFDVASFANEYRRHLAAHEIVCYWSQFIHSRVFNNYDAYPGVPNWADYIHGKTWYLPSQLVHRHNWGPDLRRQWVASVNAIPLPPPTADFLVCPWILTWVDWKLFYSQISLFGSWRADPVQWQTEVTHILTSVATWPAWRRRLGYYPLSWPTPLGWSQLDDYLTNAVHQAYDHLDVNPDLTVTQQPGWLEDVLHAPIGPLLHAFIYERNVLVAVFEQCMYDVPNHVTGLPTDVETSVWMHRAGGVARGKTSHTAVLNLDFGISAIRQKDAQLIYEAARVDPRWYTGPDDRSHAIMDALKAYMAGQYRCGTYYIGLPPINLYSQEVESSLFPPDHLFDHVYESWWLKFKDRMPNFAFPPDPETEYWLDYFHSSPEVWDNGGLPPGGTDPGADAMPLIWIMLRALNYYAQAAGLWA